MALKAKKLTSEPWLRSLKNWPWSHGSEAKKIDLRAMAPNTKKMDLRAMAPKLFGAMALSPKKLTSEPWLRGPFDKQILTSHFQGDNSHGIKLNLSIRVRSSNFSTVILELFCSLVLDKITIIFY